MELGWKTEAEGIRENKVRNTAINFSGSGSPSLTKVSLKAFAALSKPVSSPSFRNSATMSSKIIPMSSVSPSVSASLSSAFFGFFLAATLSFSCTKMADGMDVDEVAHGNAAQVPEPFKQQREVLGFASTIFALIYATIIFCMLVSCHVLLV